MNDFLESTIMSLLDNSQEISIKQSSLDISKNVSKNNYLIPSLITSLLSY